MRWWMLLYFFGTMAFARQVQFGNGIVCVDTSSTFMMRDTSSSCGQATTFCTTPLNCFSNRQYLGGGVVTCRAVSGGSNSSVSAAGVGSTGLSCPSLQTCADEPHQEFINESEASRWQPGGQPNPPPRDPSPPVSNCGIPVSPPDCMGTTDVVTSWYFDRTIGQCRSYLSGNSCQRGPFRSFAECRAAVAAGQCR